MSLGSKPKSKWALVIQPLCLKPNKVKRTNLCVLSSVIGFSKANQFWDGFLLKLINKHIGKNTGWIRQSKRDQDWRVDYNCAVVMYFENVSINRTARCSSSLHYPAAGRMPETHLSKQLGVNVCKVVMVEKERLLKVRRKTTPQGIRHCTGVPDRMGPV